MGNQVLEQFQTVPKIGSCFSNICFAFVILNYNTSGETKKCVSAILLRTKNIINKKIVIVDNGSSNEDYKTLQNEYSKSENIFVLSLEKNIGFANGNDYGYKWLTENCITPDFTIFLNNDVYIISNDFCEQIVNEYLSSQFSLLGPRIILGDNTIDRCPFLMPTKKNIQKEICRFKVINFLSRLKIVRVYFICEYIKTILNKFKKHELIDKSERKENVLLHGACLIFSKKYFESFIEPFDTRTFLYKEEELLFLRLLKQNLISIFNPDLVVFHRGGVSTGKGKSFNSLWRFRSNCYIQSLKILLEEI